MFNIYSVAFFGHRYIDNPKEIEDKLEEIIMQIIDENEYVEFLVGRNGEFDNCVASAVHRVRKNHRDDNSDLILVLPYPTAEYTNNKEYFDDYYTDVQISYKASISHPKSAIGIRNREMVDRADLIVFYVTEEQGGAWEIVKYANKKGKRIVNIDN